MELYRYNAYELCDLLKDKKISSLELTQSFLDRISSVDKTLNSFITVCDKSALKSAMLIDEKRMKGESLSRLAGIPVGIKDNISVKGIKMTCASKMLDNYTAPYSADVIERIEQNGAVILGKLNMDEFAMGSSTQTSYYGVCRNPYDTSRVAGGSSGGCAAAVSAGESVLALGSDTGGSVRQPASFCGVVGLKPTYGLVSRYGLTAFASSLDQIGPVCRCVKDTAMLLNVIAAKDHRDATSINAAHGDYYKELNDDIKGMKIGVPWELFENYSQPSVLESFRSALKMLVSRGAQITDVSIENTKYALAAYYVISSAEASSNLARFDGVRFGFRADNCDGLNDLYVQSRSQGFGEECKRRIMLGTFALSAGYYDDYYKKAVSAANLLIKSLKKLFEQVDIIAMPTSPETAFGVGDKLDDPVKMYHSDIFTVFANLSGMPAISIPCGIDENGLPIGLQFMSDRLCEQKLLNTSFAFESSFEGIPHPKI